MYDLKFAKKISVVFLVLIYLLFPVNMRAETKIAVLGDSLTKGHGLTVEEAFPYLLEAMLKEKNHLVTVINGGISGSTTTGGLDRLKWMMRNNPQIVIIALGANDGLRMVSIEEIHDNLAEMIEYAQNNGAKVVLAGMRLPPTYPKAYRKNFESLFPFLAEEYEITLIPFLLEGVAGVRTLNLADGMHPNEEGHEIIAQTVYSYVEPLL